MMRMALECKVKSFEDGILVGEIVNVNADERKSWKRISGWKCIEITKQEK